MVQKGVPSEVVELHSADTRVDRDVLRPVGACPLGRVSQGPTCVRTGDLPSASLAFPGAGLGPGLSQAVNTWGPWAQVT